LIGTASIWRVCRSILQAIDQVHPVQSN
jgi:hypothetical protein